MKINVNASSRIKIKGSENSRSKSPGEIVNKRRKSVYERFRNGEAEVWNIGARNQRAQA
jgi:hypothetical protein